LFLNQNIPPKLNVFKNNFSLFKDYSNNPTFTGFEKVNKKFIFYYFDFLKNNYKYNVKDKLLACLYYIQSQNKYFYNK